MENKLLDAYSKLLNDRVLNDLLREFMIFQAREIMKTQIFTNPEQLFEFVNIIVKKYNILSKLTFIDSQFNILEIEKLFETIVNVNYEDDEDFSLLSDFLINNGIISVMKIKKINVEEIKFQIELIDSRDLKENVIRTIFNFQNYFKIKNDVTENIIYNIIYQNSFKFKKNNWKPDFDKLEKLIESEFKNNGIEIEKKKNDGIILYYIPLFLKLELREQIYFGKIFENIYKILIDVPSVITDEMIMGSIYITSERFTNFNKSMIDYMNVIKDLYIQYGYDTSFIVVEPKMEINSRRLHTQPLAIDGDFIKYLTNNTALRVLKWSILCLCVGLIGFNIFHQIYLKYQIKVSTFLSIYNQILGLSDIKYEDRVLLSTMICNIPNSTIKTNMINELTNRGPLEREKIIYNYPNKKGNEIENENEKDDVKYENEKKKFKKNIDDLINFYKKKGDNENQDKFNNLRKKIFEEKEDNNNPQEILNLEKENKDLISDVKKEIEEDKKEILNLEKENKNLIIDVADNIIEDDKKILDLEKENKDLLIDVADNIIEDDKQILDLKNEDLKNKVKENMKDFQKKVEENIENLKKYEDFERNDVAEFLINARDTIKSKDDSFITDENDEYLQKLNKERRVLSSEDIQSEESLKNFNINEIIEDSFNNIDNTFEGLEKINKELEKLKFESEISEEKEKEKENENIIPENIISETKELDDDKEEIKDEDWKLSSISSNSEENVRYNDEYLKKNINFIKNFHITDEIINLPSLFKPFINTTKNLNLGNNKNYNLNFRGIKLIMNNKLLNDYDKMYELLILCNDYYKNNSFDFLDINYDYIIDDEEEIIKNYLSYIYNFNQLIFLFYCVYYHFDNINIYNFCTLIFNINKFTDSNKFKTTIAQDTNFYNSIMNFYFLMRKIKLLNLQFRNIFLRKKQFVNINYEDEENNKFFTTLNFLKELKFINSFLYSYYTPQLLINSDSSNNFKNFYNNIESLNLIMIHNSPKKYKLIDFLFNNNFINIYRNINILNENIDFNLNDFGIYSINDNLQGFEIKDIRYSNKNESFSINFGSSNNKTLLFNNDYEDEE